MNILNGFLAGTVIGFGAFCIVTGVGAGFKIVQFIGKKLGVKPFDE